MLPKENRRRWKRRPFDAQIRLEVDYSADRQVVDGRGVRLSEGGLCLFAAANLPLGSQVNVEFPSPVGHEPVRVRGKVRNRMVYLYGVEFLSERREDRQQLARLGAEIRNGNGFASA